MHSIPRTSMAPLTSAIRAVGLLGAVASSSHVSAASLLSPFLSRFQQCRNASIISSLSDTSGAYNKRIRRGRGPASGKGKTSGRGHKGQKQHGKVPAGFTGGQTPDEVVHGKRGFENIFSVNLEPLNVTRLQKWISTGRIDPRRPITVVELVRSGCLSGVKEGVKLLARKDALYPLTTPIQIVVSRASASAIEAVERVGGQVLTRYYTESSLRRIMKGETHPFYSARSQPLLALNAPVAGKTATAGAAEDEGEATVTDALLQEKQRALQKFKYRLPDPARRKDLEYYRDEAHRGYLSYLVEPGESPSLYFRKPGNVVDQARAPRKAGAKAENKIW